MTDRAQTSRQYRGHWCQLSVQKVFENLFKWAFWMINSRYFFDRMYIYTEKNICRISHIIWIYYKIATHSFYFCCTNWSTSRMDIMYSKRAKPIYQIRSRVILRKHPTLLAKNARNPYSLGMAYIAKPTWPFRAFFVNRVGCLLGKTQKLCL